MCDAGVTAFRLNELFNLLPSFFIRHDCGGDGGARVGRRAQHRSGAAVLSGDGRELDAGKYQVAIAGTLRFRNCPTLDSALLCRLALSKSDWRAGRAIGSDRAGAPDRVSIGSKTITGQERPRLGFSLLDFVL